MTDGALSTETLRAILRARVTFAPDGTPRVRLNGGGSFAWPGETEARRQLRQRLDLDRLEARHAAEELAEVVAAALRASEVTDTDQRKGDDDEE